MSPQLGAFVLQVRLFLGAAEAAFEVGDPGDELESGHRLVEAHAIAKARTTARVITSAAVTSCRSFVYRPGRAGKRGHIVSQGFAASSISCRWKT